MQGDNRRIFGSIPFWNKTAQKWDTVDSLRDRAGRANHAADELLGAAVAVYLRRFNQRPSRVKAQCAPPLSSELPDALPVRDAKTPAREPSLNLVLEGWFGAAVTVNEKFALARQALC